MTRVLSGKPVADKLREEISQAVARFRSTGIVPKVAIVRVGSKPDDLAYEERVVKNCLSVGIESTLFTLESGASMEELLLCLDRLNKDRTVHGILLFRPLPDRFDMGRIARAIDPSKDIDCMSPVNAEKIFIGDSSAIPPCTPVAVIEILRHYDYAIEGANVTIVNRSMVLGKPLAMLLLDLNATVTICHSRSRDTRSITKKADIVVTGVGKANHFDAGYFSEGSVVVDAGINFDNGVICGDVDRRAVEGIPAALTPVPGGVGTVTSMILLRNVLIAIGLQEQGTAI